MFPLTPDQHHWLEVATEDEGWCSFTSCTPSRSRARTSVDIICVYPDTSCSSGIHVFGRLCLAWCRRGIIVLLLYSCAVRPNNYVWFGVNRQHAASCSVTETAGCHGHQTRRMAIANGTCVSFCNQPKAHFGVFCGYAPGTIAVNFTWMERGLNAGQTHSSIYPFVFNRLRAIARWSEIATFSYPLHLTPPLGCSHRNSGKKFGPQKTRIMGLPGSEDSLTIGWAVLTQYQRVTYRRPAYINNVRSMTDAR